MYFLGQWTGLGRPGRVWAWIRYCAKRTMIGLEWNELVFALKPNPCPKTTRTSESGLLNSAVPNRAHAATLSTSFSHHIVPNPFQSSAGSSTRARGFFFVFLKIPVKNTDKQYRRQTDNKQTTTTNRKLARKFLRAIVELLLL